jgi:hypothetical protein
LKVERAKKHIRDLEAAVKGFLDGEPYKLVPDRDPESGKYRPRVSVRQEPPDDLSLIAGDAVHNLRSALDLLVWQLVLANGQTPGDQTALPIARSAKLFETGGMGPIKGVSPTAENAIKALKPYKGGNEALWRLHRLDATDKHRILLIVGLALRQVTMTLNFPGSTKAIGITLGLNQEDDKFFPLKDGDRLFPEFFDAMDLTPDIPNLEKNLQLGFNVAFGEGEVVKGEPLVPTLVQLADYVSGTVEAFRPEFA